MTAHITQILDRAAQLYSEAPALQAFGGECRSWKELYGDVQLFAGALKNIGVAPNSQVAIMSLNSAKYFESLFAIPSLGARIVPLNIRWAEPELEYALVDSDSQYLIFDQIFAPLVGKIHGKLDCISHYIYTGDAEGCPEWAIPLDTLLADATPHTELVSSDDDLVGIFYTGGTTGFPKGVMLQHGAMLSSAMCVTASVDANQDSVVLHSAPMFHLADLVSCFAYTMMGAKHLIVSMFEPKMVMACLQQHKATDLLLVPTMIQLLVEHPEFADYQFSGLRNLLYGASPMPEGLLRRILSDAPHLNLVQAYGQTEMAPVISLLVDSDHSLEDDKKHLLRAAGRPVPTVCLKIVDENNRALATGEVGEICARGPSVMRGYWNKPEETAAALVGGWLHTGDAGYVDDQGYLFVVDRVKDMIVSGGENVYSAEVENTISLLPGVLQVAVIGIPDSQWGERVHAVVVVAPDAGYSSQMILDHCKQYIAAYKCPKSFDITFEALPLSSTGKVLKRELRDKYQ
jgi:acyl-CoA synthetase (AMP-forming)/AMP-acid ligase II